ncbi:LysR family transcriptional regulator [Paenirhodobacter populi]|uniref:LysR family transcriptional regulator n=1 Tax=Paenirhodobacter populi TaxID=2306993 RepID=UPI0013E2E6F0|nr:LysR family transcriptional regulator [Sinirhodobacter populi]
MQTRLVLEIATQGQLQVAANLCGLTQPAASRMLAEIETQLGERLFTRTPHGMEPTPAGALIAHHAQRITHDHAQLAAEYGELRAGRGGIVRVGAVTGPALGHIVPAINWLKGWAPEVDISVEVAPSVTLVPALARGDLDFALARLPPQIDDSDFEIEPARDEIVRLLVREGHPMLGHGPVAIAQLHHLPWILQDRGMPIRRVIEAAFHDEGLSSPSNVISASSLLVIVALLRESDAIAPMSQEVMELMLEPPVSAGFRRLDLNRLVTVEPYLLLRARGRAMPKAAEALFRRVRESIRHF